MAFQDVVGHARVKRILGMALRKERLPNSLLFDGPDGVGKMQTALVVAKALNCLNKIDDACEECSSCRSINKGNCPDVMVISPESNILKIDRIRELKETAHFKPMVGKRRVFLVEGAEKMNKEAANSILKILEEPPLFCFIILLTSNSYLLLSTIKSRCQMLRFAPITQEDICDCLISRGSDPGRARIMSLLARGNLKYALDLEWDDIQNRRGDAMKLFRILMGGGRTSGVLKEYSGKQRKAAEEEIGPVLEILASFLRDAMLIREGGDRLEMMNPDYEAELTTVASQIETESIFRKLEQIDQLLGGFRRNVNMRIFSGTLILNFMEV